ncbi:hypothetical protein PG984_005639 [Apiospora sp. TS-2023a]
MCISRCAAAAKWSYSTANQVLKPCLCRIRARVIPHHDVQGEKKHVAYVFAKTAPKMTFHSNLRRTIVALAALEGFSQDILGHATSTSMSATSTLSTASTVTSALSSSATPSLEADFIFPRDKIYKEADVLPVAVAFRGLDAVRKDVGKFSIIWCIELMSQRGSTPPASTWTEASLTSPTARTRSSPSPARTSRTGQTKMSKRVEGDRYALVWAIDFLPRVALRDTWPSDQREMLFDIRLDLEARFGLPDGIDPVVPADGCRRLGQLLEFRPAPECRMVVNETTAGWPGDPCGVQIDEAVASSIQSQASSTVAAAWSTRHPGQLPTPTSYNLAALPTVPVGSAFVAVSLMTYLTFGL